MAREGYQAFRMVEDRSGRFADKVWFNGPSIGWPWEEAEPEGEWPYEDPKGGWSKQDEWNLFTPAMFRRFRVLRANAVLEVAPTPTVAKGAEEATLATQAVLSPDGRTDLKSHLKGLWTMGLWRDVALVE